MFDDVIGNFYLFPDDVDVLLETLSQLLLRPVTGSCRLEQLQLPSTVAADPKLSAVVTAAWREAWGPSARIAADISTGDLLLSVT